MNQLIAAIREIVGPQGVLEGEDVRARPATVQGGSCEARAIIRPGSTEEVSRVLRLCHEASQPVVPYGGGTGLVEGAVASPGELMLSLERMNRIEEVDTLGRAMVVQAGVPVQRVQETAEDAGLFFAVDFGARGTATIGGAISTNAGGNRVLRYGMLRDQVLGLEAVMADGTVVSAMQRFIKNNAGYDLKHLFIGSEGTLGIVTRAALRLRPLPRSRHTAMLALDRYQHVQELLALLDTELGGTLSGFEVMWNDFYRMVVEGPTGHRPPLGVDHGYYVLVECLSADPAPENPRFRAALEQAMQRELVSDAVIAESRAQQDALWAIRDDIPTLLQLMAPLLPFDISLNLHEIDAFVLDVRERLSRRWPEVDSVSFGHLGDGNLHLVVGIGQDNPERRRQVDDVVYNAVRERGGSVSAEHGIGKEKLPYLAWSRSAEEVSLMRTLKGSLDPRRILNPGKLLD
ncbi:MAG: FAD-binding oxidoreductase [Ectothiorhodospiraceae bacterium]|nr:FAD-binding oxidoreductase [Ectothiorhodospiraceae bacterium]